MMSGLMKYFPVFHPAGKLRLPNFVPDEIVKSTHSHHLLFTWNVSRVYGYGQRIFSFARNAKEVIHTPHDAGSREVDEVQA